MRLQIYMNSTHNGKALQPQFVDGTALVLQPGQDAKFRVIAEDNNLKVHTSPNPPSEFPKKIYSSSV